MEQVVFHAAGDSALLVEFAPVISLEENRKVLALKAALERRSVPGTGEAVPSYRSLLIRYDPVTISFEALKDIVESCLEGLSSAELPAQTVVEIPTCYEGPYALDLDAVAELEGTAPDRIVDIHTSEDNFIYLLGFAPGQPYGARMHRPFSFGRRETPRVRVPAGSIAVQLALTDILPFDQPCGWNIIGATPVNVFDIRRANPFLLQAGQWFRHIPISEADFLRIRSQVELGTYNCRSWKREVSE